MVRAARVVEHLRLRGASESAVRHALPALEDAFRTASLPDVGARVICVRRLQLGPLAANASAQSVSLLIEKRFAEDDWTIVHAVERGAGDAPAVWFRDVFEAYEIAALRLAAGQPLDAWFWPRALPGIMAVPSDQRLRATAFAVAATEEAPGALPAWTASLVRAGYRARLLAALRPNDGDALLRAAGLNHVPFERARTGGAGSQGPPDVRQADRTLDDREIFVEAMVDRSSGRAMHSRPGRSATQESASPVERTVKQSRDKTFEATPDVDADAQAHRARGTEGVAQQKEIECQALASPARGGEPAGNPRADADSAQPAGEPPSAGVDGEWVGRHSSQPLTVGDARQASDAVARDRSPVDDHEAPASPWRLPYAAPTSAGGLLFLLPVLEQVGFAKWAAQRGAQEPEPEVLAAEILHLLLLRLRVDKEDPAWALAAAFRLKPESCVHADTWLTACRRFLRRGVRIGLASLVVRRARLAITSTHVDVFFGLNAADLRIRRAGLDIDPGWVPWFGRVVAFHYGDRPWN